jgi:hypothetical protein
LVFSNIIQNSSVQARKRQGLYYNENKKPSLVYIEGEMVLLLRKFIESRRLNSKLDYRYIGPFRVIKMVGKNAVELDIAAEYPRLHPVFNVSLIVCYVSPNSIIDRGLVEGIKEKYYKDEEVVDWTLVKSVLDARSLREGKYDFLVLWKGATVANDAWIAEHHFPSSMSSYLQTFRELHAELFGGKKKKKNKIASKKPVEIGV